MPSFLDIYMNRVEANLNGATLFSRSLYSFDETHWNDYKNRLVRYEMYNAYYLNEVYSRLLEGSSLIKFEKGFYPYIRGIYNPVSRLADLYVSKVFGGSIDFKNPKVGAIPILAEEEQLEKDILQIWKWSNWNSNKTNYVRYGSILGDSFIKIVDNQEKERVYFEVIDPKKIRDVKFDSLGNIEYVVIQYFREYEGKIVEYKEIIDNESFSTFKDGKPFGFYSDLTGKRVQRWDNDYGFVPMILTKHKNVGHNFGANAFFTQLNKLDEINDEASLLNDQIRKAIDVVWFFPGSSNKSSIESPPDIKKDDIKALYNSNKDAKAIPMVFDINIEAALSNLKTMIDEIEKDMPELSLYKIRDRDRLTAPGIKAAYSDAVDRILEARVNYDSGLIQANKMALAIAGFRNYINGYSLEDYLDDTENVEHYFGDRPIVADELDLFQKVTVLQNTQANPEFIWKQLGYSEELMGDIKNPNPPVPMNNSFNGSMSKNNNPAQGLTDRPSPTN